MVCAHSSEGSHLVWGDPHEVEGGAYQVESRGASRWSNPHIGVNDRQTAGFPAPMVLWITCWWWGSRSCRWFRMRVPILVGRPRW